MITALFLAIALPTWAMYHVVGAGLVITNGKSGRLPLVLGLALGLGLGLTACSYLLWRVAVGAPDWRYLACESIALLVVGLFARQRHLANQRGALPVHVESVAPVSGILRWLPWASWATLLLTAAALVLGYRDEPMGSSDAWCIWNHRARVLHRGGDAWQSFLTAEAPHADYPLLAPACSARLWAYGGETRWGPWLVQSLFMGALCAVIYGGVALVTTRSMGHLALLALLADVRIAQLAVTQYAETALQFYFAAAVIAAGLAATKTAPRVAGYALSGLLAALAAWTKNEGIMFVAVAGLTIVISSAWYAGWRGAFENTRAWLAGGIAVLLLVALYKLSVQVDNDLVAGQNLSDTWQRLTDLSRWSVVLGGAGRITATVLKAAVVLLPLAAMALGPSKDRSLRPAAMLAVAVLALMSAGFALVLITTPNDLQWHVNTSVDRLISQLFPIAIWAAACWLAAPEHLLEQGKYIPSLRPDFDRAQPQGHAAGTGPFYRRAG
ncbi:MAG: hypothetical protein JSS27_00870 [Planctomycetes bacterium]|nr:hypothetical protein [Planctomycetota bacterium]